MSDTMYRRPNEDDDVVVVETVETRSRFGPFVAGFLTAVVAAAVAIGIWFVASDADDDGNIEVDVPAVELDVNG